MKDVSKDPRKKPTDVGLNRTGIAASPIDGKATMESADRVRPSSTGDDQAILAVRAELARASGPIGTMPVPLSVKGAVSTAKDVLKGEKSTVLLDKLGERLAFERTGVRLYQAVLAKHPGASHKEAPPIALLEENLEDELRHFGIVKDAMERLGADPSAMTPCADVIAVASRGLIEVVADPRTTMTQCLDALLTAELTDNAAWEMLIELATALGHEDLTESFGRALAEEERHLERVRGWLAERVFGDAGVQPPVLTPTSPVT